MDEHAPPEKLKYQMEELQAENQRLHHILAELLLQNQRLREKNVDLESKVA